MFLIRTGFAEIVKFKQVYQGDGEMFQAGGIGRWSGLFQKWKNSKGTWSRVQNGRPGWCMSEALRQIIKAGFNTQH